MRIPMARRRVLIVTGVGVVLLGVTAYSAVVTILGVGTIPRSELFDDPATLTVRQMILEPGEALPWHYHPGVGYTVVKSGRLTLEDGCGGEQTLTAGQAFEEVHGEVHRAKNVFMFPAEVYNTFVVPAGMPTTVQTAGNARLCGPPINANQCRGDGWRQYSFPRTFSSQDDCEQYLVGASGPSFSEWTVPVHLGPVLNSDAPDFLPAFSRDGLSLYFSSTRRGGLGGEDIWVSQRPSTDDPWGPPVSLPTPVNTDANERSPDLSRDGHFLYFSSSRPGGAGGFDIWASWRANTRDDFAWQPPVNLGPGVNGTAGEFGPTYFENSVGGIPTLFFTSNRAGGAGGIDILASTLLTGGAFSPAVPVTELNTPQNDFRPAIRNDGLEIIFDSNRPGLGSAARDLWVSTRASVTEPWSAPVNLGPPVNTAALDETLPALSPDGTELIISGSGRPDDLGGGDLYLSKRKKRSR